MPHMSGSPSPPFPLQVLIQGKSVNKGVYNFTPYQILSEKEHIFTFVFVAVMGVEPTLGIGL